mmetsp:Transcript_14243/g.22995  ORF Transcript_14243/g.22995 Transcript_14243/m.22995 type:complete len:104 (+) Transcript_14243:1333-1644(+)
MPAAEGTLVTMQDVGMKYDDGDFIYFKMWTPPLLPMTGYSFKEQTGVGKQHWSSLSLATLNLVKEPSTGRHKIFYISHEQLPIIYCHSMVNKWQRNICNPPNL